MATESTAEEDLNWAEISVRVILGGVFIWAGLAKLIDLDAFVSSVSNFEIAPFNSVPWDMWLGYMLPVFELTIGSCLILGVLLRGAIVSVTLMSLGFLAAIISVHMRGLNIECGCFGKALTFDNYYTHIVILAVMCILAFYLILVEFIKSKKDHTTRQKLKV